MVIFIVWTVFISLRQLGPYLGQITSGNQVVTQNWKHLNRDMQNIFIMTE